MEEGMSERNSQPQEAKKDKKSGLQASDWSPVKFAHELGSADFQHNAFTLLKALSFWIFFTAAIGICQLSHKGFCEDQMCSTNEDFMIIYYTCYPPTCPMKVLPHIGLYQGTLGYSSEGIFLALLH